MLLSAFSVDLIEAGCDEAGRGCLAGPVVAAAVILPKNYRHELLNDSKQLDREERAQLRIDIERDAIAWAVAEVDNEEIDRINILMLLLKPCIWQLVCFRSDRPYYSLMVTDLSRTPIFPSNAL
jgi:ribonuclease HII